MRLRAEHPVFRRRRFFAGSADHGGESDLGDIAWFEPDGEHMDEEAWANGYAKSLMVFLNGRAIRETDSRGGAIRDDSFLVLFNAHYEPIDFVIPEASYGQQWFVEIDTAGGTAAEEVSGAAGGVTPDLLVPGATVTVAARSILVLGSPLPDED
jgi:glycogen operon protein